MNLSSFYEENSIKKTFFNPKEKKNSMITNVNNLFYRMDLNDKEIRILASIIGTLSKKKKSIIDIYN